MMAALPLVLATVVAAGADGQIIKERFSSGGAQRSYHLFVPVGGARPAPLIVLLHGSGRDGRSLAEPWRRLAAKEGIMLAAPDSFKRESWGMREDGPHFLHELIETISEKHPVDRRRMYLFGHSGGALQALAIAVLEPEYFAAVAVHAGVLPDFTKPFLESAPRKIPVALWVGTNDSLFPVPAVRATRDALTLSGFPVELTEIPGHTHRYYDRASDINQSAWTFLKSYQLSGEPKYQVYAIPSR
jgi:poly(3-hydroxybutyrate) depolymerase